ncbi:hypothetical protein D3C78_1213560 [compost metagenome]
MIVAHRLTGQHRLAAPAPHGLGHCPRLEQKLVALQHHIFIPCRAVQAEGNGGTLLAPRAHGGVSAGLAPLRQPRHDQILDQRGRAGTPVFPWKIAVPVLPANLRHAGFTGFARQAQIADRHDARARFVGTVAVGKGVELFYIAQRMMGLRFHPGAQASLQRTMRQFERPGRQGACVIRGQHARLAIGHGHQHGDEFGMDGAFDGFGQG